MSHETATLITNICIAAGTIGSASIAVAFGLSAARRESTERQARIDVEASQVICFLRWIRGGEETGKRPVVDVLNASPTMITNVHVAMHVPPAGHGQRVDFMWLTAGNGRVPFVRAGGEQRLRLLMQDADDPGGPLDTAHVSRAAQLTVTWLDTRGAWWARTGLGVPYSTTPAQPGREVATLAQQPGWIRGHLTEKGRRHRREVRGLRPQPGA